MAEDARMGHGLPGAWLHATMPVPAGSYRNPGIGKLTADVFPYLNPLFAGLPPKILRMRIIPRRFRLPNPPNLCPTPTFRVEALTLRLPSRILPRQSPRLRLPRRALVHLPHL